jgi:hypothetical protein
MTRRRNIAGTAAIGGLTGALVLLTGLPAAKSDELSANQPLLQQRLDQLPQAQAPAAPPQAPGATPGTITPDVDDNIAGPDRPLAAGSFPGSFLIPGTETSIRIGGFVGSTFGYRTAR